MQRAGVQQEMEQARLDFHELVKRASAEDLSRRSTGTRWTNRQLLFHMVFWRKRALLLGHDRPARLALPSSTHWWGPLPVDCLGPRQVEVHGQVEGAGCGGEPVRLEVGTARVRIGVPRTHTPSR
jgi:hypothetical protein